MFCQYQDPANYYFVEFDRSDDTVLIGQYLDDEFIEAGGDTYNGDWMDASDFLSPPGEVTHIAVSCYLNEITLFINNEWVTTATVGSPFETTGTAAFFVYAFEDADKDGYEVYFDNVDIWEPRQ